MVRATSDGTARRRYVTVTSGTRTTEQRTTEQNIMTDKTFMISGIGAAASTITSGQTVIQLFDHIRRTSGKETAFSDMIEEEVEDDYLRLTFCHLVNWACSNIVPQNWKIVKENGMEILVPKNEKNTNILTGERLVQYFGTMLALFRVKFPNHRDFKNLDENDRQAVPKWWSNARNQAIKAIDKYQKSLGGNYTFGQTDCHPIYPDNDKGDLGRALLDFYAKIDLLSIARKLFTDVADMQGDPTKSVGKSPEATLDDTYIPRCKPSWGD